MNRLLLITFFLLLSHCLVAQEKEEKLIRQNFACYCTFLYTSNGTETVKLVDSRTIAYYAEILEHVKNADSVKVASLNLLDKLMVLIVRQAVPKSEFFTFNGKSFLSYAINKGMIDKSSPGFMLDSLTIEDDFAKAQMKVNGFASPQYVHFYKEHGIWKYDLSSSFPVALPFLEKIAAEMGGEQSFIRLALAQHQGTKQCDNVWLPLNTPGNE